MKERHIIDNDMGLIQRAERARKDENEKAAANGIEAVVAASGLIAEKKGR